MPLKLGTVTPPDELMRYTCSHDNVAEYLLSGAEVALQFELASEAHFKKPISSFNSILDFGCGAGRLLDTLDFGSAVVTACDVGQGVAEFSKNTFPNFDVRQTGLLPPLPFEDESFDLVYSFSVFSHLTKEVEDIWINELFRIGKSGCNYLITIHGDWMIEATLSDEEKLICENKGFYYKTVHKRHHNDLDFPDYYEASYHTSEYIRDHWSKWFDIVEIIKGDNPARYLSNHQSFESSGGNVPDFRPMGQDLVIARKK